MDDAQIEQMIRDAEKAGEPGEQQKVIHRGDDEVPAAIAQASLQSAGWVYLYDTVTHERSICNRNMLQHALQKKRPDGSDVFTVHVPDVGPMRGAHKCMLHAEGPNREHYNDLGFAVCKKSNLRSPYEVRRHMQKRHKAEWAAIQEEREEQRRQEDRDFQRELLGRAKPVEAPPEVYESKADKAKRLAAK